MSRSRIADACPLSALQAGMLFHHLREPRSGVDVEQIVIHLQEPVDASRMAAAWQYLVQRHDILRARLVWQGVREPFLEILSEVPVALAVEDGRVLADAVQRGRLGTFLAADREAGFDLDRAPLLRLTLFAWTDTSFSLVWTFHHVLLDGRTFPLLLREVFDTYEALQAGQIEPRPPPQSFRHCAEQRTHADQPAADTFWTALLAGFSAPTPLMVDRRTAGATTRRQAEAWEALDPVTTLRLRSLADASALTMSSIVMAAWAILLHRYSGDENVLFGTTRACRASTDQSIGLRINTVPVRVRVRADEPVSSVLRAVRQQWIDVRPYERTPLARIKALGGVPASRPLFETLVVFERYRLDTAMQALGGAWASRHVDLHELTNVPVTLAAYDGDTLSLKLTSHPDRLEDEAARRMVGHLRQLLEAIAADPTGAVAGLPLVGPAERQALIEAAAPPVSEPRTSAVPRDGAATLHSLFEAQAERRPDARALTCEGASLTYAQVNAWANRLARALVLAGVERETLVALYVDRSNDLVVAVLAILKAGGAYLPLDPAYPPDRLAFIIGDARATVLLTERALAASLPRTETTMVYVDEVLAAPAATGDDADLRRAGGPDDLAYVIYTSGTTGRPKGSLITHRNVVRLFPAAEACFDFGQQDVWTLFHSIAFDFSVWEIWGALLYGGRLVVVPQLVSRSPDAFRELLAVERVSVLNQTPSAFRLLMQARHTPGGPPLSLRYVVFGGEALDFRTLRPWFEQHGDREPRLVNMYGITETTVHVTYRRISTGDLESGSVIGTPLGDLRLHILDAGREPCPVGVPGELYVGGAGLARGYLRRSELTAERFAPDPFSMGNDDRLYRTGDRGRRLAAGDIEYLGRIDDQVKIRGFRIELGEIESVLREHPCVCEAVVLAREDIPGIRHLVAYVVPRSQAQAGLLRAHLRQQLPDYMVPASFVFLPRLPLTSHGKVDRQALPAAERARPDTGARYMAPASAAEVLLAGIWSKVLGVQQVGVQDNFFELGGDSILSIQLISLARRSGLELSLKVLFATPTIAALAAASRAATALPPSDAPVVGEVPLTPIQAWFFEQQLDRVNHYNQAVLLETDAPLDVSLLHRALDAVRLHHDALGLRFVRGPAGWRQYHGTADEAVPLTCADLTPLDETDQCRTLQALAADAHASLDIERGPIWRVVHIAGGPRRSYLLFVVHHLAVDGVSWRPLLEDLETAYRQLDAGEALRLPSKTSSYQQWANRLQGLVASETLQAELPYWTTVTRTPEDLHQIEDHRHASASADAAHGEERLTVALTGDETHALLQVAPAAYRTQINDVLLTAVLRGWTRATATRLLVTDLEGHGREPLFDDLDLSRTVGWFTSIFPVRLELAPSDTGADWNPGHTLKAVKEQLRGIPGRGIGYGLLRYGGAGQALAAAPERVMLLNYLGQSDQILAGSRLFRFASESAGSWRSETRHRSHAIEANCVVRNGALEISWVFREGTRRGLPEIGALADEVITALREVIGHCQSPNAFGRTLSDFPLARLTVAELDRLVAGRRDVEDIYPLSPIQALFFSAAGGAGRAAFDQWHCTLAGALDVPAFQRSWRETLQRHAVLRSTIHGEPADGPVQVVHRDAAAPWTVHDWRRDARASDEGWAGFLARDRARPLALDGSPPMRFALVQTGDETWKFLWTLSALLLDGWSWPLVFRDVSQLYDAFARQQAPALPPARQYRDYLQWLAAQSPTAGELFWRETLAGFRAPTPLPGAVDAPDAPAVHRECAVPISAHVSKALHDSARHAQVTLSALLQGAWALLLARQTGLGDVLFGAAFSGRPADLEGAGEIVGPFVNNLPVRVTVRGDDGARDFFRGMHNRLLDLSLFVSTALVDIQRVSVVPWRQRLFDSLVVVQNYAVDAAARRLGDRITIEAFCGPIHTNYTVLLLVEPGGMLRVTLIYDPRRIGHAVVHGWGRDLETLLTHIPDAIAANVPVVSLLNELPPARALVAAGRPPDAVSRSLVPPQTAMERAVAAVWQQLFDIGQVGVEQSFFELGGTSLVLLQMHTRLQAMVGITFPIVAIFEHPTLRGLAGWLAESAEPPAGPTEPRAESGDRWRRRAERQKKALGQLRPRAVK